MESLRKRIDDAFDQDRLAAVLVSVNSPGGSPVQSELISTYLQMKAKKEKVSVTMFVEDMAASGGYWIACAGHQVYASKTSIIGSLGVIMETFGFEELIKKIGIERRILAAGENKALLDPFSPLKDEDVRIVKQMLADSHKIFIEHVKKNRGSKLKGTDEELFNGAVWTGEPALKLGLIDGIDNMDEFILRNFGDDVYVKRVKSKGQELAELFGSSSPKLSIEDLLKSEQLSKRTFQ